MNKVALSVTIIKSQPNFECIQKFIICTGFDDAHDQLVNFIVGYVKNLNIDFPLELTDFEYIWFDREYVNANMFGYKVLSNDTWLEPWETQDIYSDVLDRMMEQDLSDPPDFSQIYGEPNPDEMVDDKFTMEPDEQHYEIEKKFIDIINQAKSVEGGANPNNEVEECNCKKCMEGIGSRVYCTDTKTSKVSWNPTISIGEPTISIGEPVVRTDSPANEIIL